MPRRIYTYAAGQGWDGFNMASSIGSYILGVGMIVFVWNFVRSRKSGAIAGNDPWGAPTIEWAIPSPPPEYNFARLPNITSRYPMWDMKSPELTTDVPHSRGGDKEMKIDVAGKESAVKHPNPAPQSRTPSEGGSFIETETYSARELGIPMPDPTIKPFWVAVGMVVMLSAPLFMHHSQIMEAAGKMPQAKTALTMFWIVALGGASLMVGMLYNWLLTPLESDHH
jgi:heme/copper-type cytochrome/quinol oxidase subunit 1